MVIPRNESPIVLTAPSEPSEPGEPGEQAASRLHVAGADFDLVDPATRVLEDIDSSIDEDLARGGSGWHAFRTVDGWVHVRLHAGIDIAVTEPL